MIDGKLMRMSMEQITTLLNGMSADNVEKIELLNTPPAKYDADGNAGLINIVTKKSKRPGTNGSITASAGYGKYEKGSASISLSHNTGKISLRGSYSYSHDRSYSELFANGTEDVSSIGGQTAFNYSGIGKPVSNYQDVAAGIDAQLSSKTTIGYSINYSIGHDQNDSHNYGVYALKPDSILLFNSMLHGINHSRNMINSFYLDKEFNKNEKLHADMDYLYYKSDGQTMVQSSFADNRGNEAGESDSLYAPQQRDLSNTTIQVGVAKVDYTNQLSHSIKLETGIKGTYTKTSALSGIENLKNGRWVSSGVGTSSNLLTRESIGAAYTTFNLQIDSLTNLVAGARYEYSHNSTDKTVDAAYIVNRKLGKLFPAIFFTHTLNDHSELQLSYTNRITRPSYNDLASYVVYNDPVSVFTGNPALKPTITHNLKLGYNYHSYLFSLLFSRDDNPILSTQIATGPTKGLVYLSPQNAAWQNNITLQANIPVKINNWWEMRYDFTGGLRQYKVDYTPTAFEKTYFGYSANFTENFKLPKSFSIELSGYYNSASYYGTSEVYANAVVNGGIRKELNNNKGSFQLSVSDIFSAAKYRSVIGMLTRDAFNTDVRVAYNAESASMPIIKLTYYRSFGSVNKNQSRSENNVREEQGRMGNL